MTPDQTRNLIGVIGFSLLCIGAGVAWMPAGLMLCGALMLTFSIIGILRGN